MRASLRPRLPAVLLSALCVALFPGPVRASAGDDALAAFAVNDLPRARLLAKPAADKGDALALFVLGTVLRVTGPAPKSGDEAEITFQRAAAAASRGAQAGDSRSKYVLGRLNFDGLLWEQDYAKALNWFRSAAQDGYAPAQHHLGTMYDLEFGLPRDPQKAAEWYRKAADQGFAQAQRGIGMLHHLGTGVGLDLKKAAAWYEKAAAQGDAPAQNELCAMYLEGTGVDKDFSKALPMCRKAAENGEMDSQFRLGVIYHQGYGTPVDPKAAALWYRRAAENNQPEAQANLGVLYLTGLGLDKDEKAAAEWLGKAAEWGNIPAQATLGGMYLEGTGVAKNEKEAAVLYRKAAESGLASAQSMLGWMLQTGTGLPQDEAEALVWYRKAAAQGDETAKVNLASLTAEAPQAAPPAPPAPAPAPLRSDVDTPGYASPENPSAFAVVIGVERYASLPAAEFAERDAEAMRAHLMALGTPARNIYFLSGPLATRAKLAQALNTWLPNRVKEDSTVFFFYSGHGAPDAQSGRAYLVPADGDPEDLESTAFPLRELYEKLGRLKARSVVVALDSCFSGAGGRSVLAKGTRPLVVSVEEAVLPAAVVSLTASDKNQVSGTLEEQGHGAFTYYLLKGLAGAARTGTGAVTVRSLHGYLTPKVQDAARLQNRDQTPQLLPVAAPDVRLR